MGERRTTVADDNAWRQRALTGSAHATWLGVAGLVANLLFSFETPHPEWLCVSGALTCGAPLAMLWHLWRSKELTPDQKRSWLVSLARPGAAGLFASYFTPESRAASTQSLMQDAAQRARASRSSRTKA